MGEIAPTRTANGALFGGVLGENLRLKFCEMQSSAF